MTGLDTANFIHRIVKTCWAAELEIKQRVPTPELPDDISKCEPPDPISNSEVKPLSADGSVGFPHVRVGHRQASNRKTPPTAGFFYAPFSATVLV